MNCDICGKIFSLKRCLTQHRKKFHEIEPDSQRLKKLCPELNCTFSCYNQSQLRDHVLKAHEIAVEKIELQFSTWKDFDKWKYKEQQESISNFTKRCGDSSNVNGRVKKWFLCHRSGIFKTRSTGQRELKSQGSCKMGSTCTASIEAEETSQSINVVYYKTHFGHTNELGHLTLIESERKFIREHNVDENEFVNLATAGRSEDTEISERSISKINVLQEKAQMFVDLLNSKTLPPENYGPAEKKLDELLSMFGNTAEKSKEPANKNIACQRRLASVKKQRKIKRNEKNLCKPSLAEKLNIEESL